MTRSDGDGWVECAAGHPHWGRHGAAGLLVVRGGDGGATDGREVLLQHRVSWSHEGGTWGVPGGARSSTEDGVAAALREAQEEAGVDPSAVRVDAVYVEDHGAWSYATVLGEAVGPVDARPTDRESEAVRWVELDDVARRPLHPSFGAAWPDLADLVGRRLVVVVDVANVMGSTPDGWWRDRAGAAGRVLRRLAPLPLGAAASAVGLPGTPERLARWLPDVVAVVEGRANAVVEPAPAGVTLVRAPASGDDAIVDVVARRRRDRPRDAVLVVTADRGLRERVEALGVDVARPSLLARLTGEPAARED